jgi:hypothetical protein
LEPGKTKLSEIIEQTKNTELVLPEFQRSFIWSRKDIEELLISVMNQYFIGTLLLLDIDPQNPPFAPRAIEGINTQSLNSRTMILDGQQRVTSLYYALNDIEIPLSNTTYPYKFYLDINKALMNNWDEAVLSRPSRGNNDQNLEDLFVEGLLPFSALQSWDIYDDWQEKYRTYLDENGRMTDDFWSGFRRLTRGFLNYEIPYIRLLRETELEKVVEIFERINRTGTPLSVFALTSARLYKDGVNLRNLWDTTYIESPEINQYSEPKDEAFPRIILQIIALMRGKECKKKNLILLEGIGFEDDWRIASEYANKALCRVFHLDNSGYGVVSSDWLPYSTILVPLAALLKLAESNFPGNPSIYNMIHQWYWSSVFSESYAGSSDTVMYNDFHTVSRWFSNPNKIPQLIIKAREAAARTDLNRSRRGGVYKGIMCLIALNGARDFRNDDSIALHHRDDHHIFPKAVLQGRYDSDKINTILNRTLLSRITNRDLIGAKPPSQYVSEMESLMGITRVKEVLKTHFIDDIALECMMNDDFDGFIDARKKIIQNEISVRCGLA